MKDWQQSTGKYNRMELGFEGLGYFLEPPDIPMRQEQDGTGHLDSTESVGTDGNGTWQRPRVGIGTITSGYHAHHSEQPDVCTDMAANGSNVHRQEHPEQGNQWERLPGLHELFTPAILQPLPERKYIEYARRQLMPKKPVMYAEIGERVERLPICFQFVRGKVRGGQDLWKKKSEEDWWWTSSNIKGAAAAAAVKGGEYARGVPVRASSNQYSLENQNWSDSRITYHGQSHQYAETYPVQEYSQPVRDLPSPSSIERAAAERYPVQLYAAGEAAAGQTYHHDSGHTPTTSYHMISNSVPHEFVSPLSNASIYSYEAAHLPTSEPQRYTHPPSSRFDYPRSDYLNPNLSTQHPASYSRTPKTSPVKKTAPVAPYRRFEKRFYCPVGGCSRNRKYQRPIRWRHALANHLEGQHGLTMKQGEELEDFMAGLGWALAECEVRWDNALGDFARE
ncbi:hypothetical protein BDZ91DRAFT_789631 [Kalaharituber pfeilii]|nr:hypothetical protein BDZ91DRAFT_789631 [Kalaharituber pfeilii]